MWWCNSHYIAICCILLFQPQLCHWLCVCVCAWLRVHVSVCAHVHCCFIYLFIHSFLKIDGWIQSTCMYIEIDLWHTGSQRWLLTHLDEWSANSQDLTHRSPHSDLKNNKSRDCLKSALITRMTFTPKDKLLLSIALSPPSLLALPLSLSLALLHTHTHVYI